MCVRMDILLYREYMGARSLLSIRPLLYIFISVHYQSNAVENLRQFMDTGCADTLKAKSPRRHDFIFDNLTT